MKSQGCYQLRETKQFNIILPWWIVIIHRKHCQFRTSWYVKHDLNLKLKQIRSVNYLSKRGRKKAIRCFLFCFAGSDKMFATLHDHYFFKMMRQCIQMYLKYCGPCQLNSLKKLDKCPHEMQPVKVPKEAWSQISKCDLHM